MGIVKEPKGVDFIVGPSVLKDSDKRKISQVIATYQKTGKKPPAKKKVSQYLRTKKKLIS